MEADTKLTRKEPPQHAARHGPSPVGVACRLYRSRFDPSPPATCAAKEPRRDGPSAQRVYGALLLPKKNFFFSFLTRLRPFRRVEVHRRCTRRSRASNSALFRSVAFFLASSLSSPPFPFSSPVRHPDPTQAGRETERLDHTSDMACNGSISCWVRQAGPALCHVKPASSGGI